MKKVSSSVKYKRYYIQYYLTASIFSTFQGSLKLSLQKIEEKL